MKKILLTTTALIALGIAPAAAADLAARPYTKAPAAAIAINNWTGFYLGAMGGYAQENSSGIGTLSGGFAGGTAGYNWQTGNLVFGLEADGAWADVGRDRRTSSRASRRSDYTIRAMGTVRWPRRLRLRPGPRSTAPAATRGPTTACRATALGVSISDSQFHSGWTVGAGVEVMFAPKWSVKAEYLYQELRRPDLLRRHRSGRRSDRHDQPEQRSGRRELSLLRLPADSCQAPPFRSNRNGGVLFCRPFCDSDLLTAAAKKVPMQTIR